MLLRKLCYEKFHRYITDKHTIDGFFDTLVQNSSMTTPFKDGLKITVVKNEAVAFS